MNTNGMADTIAAQYYESYGCFGIAVLLFLCTYGFPFSKNLIILACGALTSRGLLTIPQGLLACMIGLFAGDFSLFIIATLGWKNIQKWFSKVLSRGNVQQVQSLIKKYGLYLSVFLARFLPYIRTPLYLNAGFCQMNIFAFIILDFLSILLWVPLMFWVGYNSMNMIDLYTLKGSNIYYTLLIIFLLILLVCTVLLYLFVKRDRQQGKNKVI